MMRVLHKFSAGGDFPCVRPGTVSLLRVAALCLMIAGASARLGCGAAYAQDNTPEKKVYEKIVSASNAIKSMTCDFTETKSLAAISSKVVKKGKMYFIAPERLRWEYDTENFGVCNASGAYMIKDGKLNGGASRAFAVVGKITTSFIAGRPADANMFSMSFRMEGKEFLVILQPKQERLKMVFDNIIMRFDPATGMIRSYETHRGGDCTKLVFNNIKLNADLDPQLFN